MTDYSDRNGNWIQTFSGKSFYPMDPRAEDISIVDIAHSLSMQCRYAGHTIMFYSIAEHCCHMYDAAPDGLKLQTLMHDASEAYLVDVPRPIKPYLAGYESIENNIMAVIARKYGFDWPVDPAVKALDYGILADEREFLMVQSEQQWNMIGEKIGANIQGWSADRAYSEFMLRYNAIRYSPEV